MENDIFLSLIYLKGNMRSYGSDFLHTSRTMEKWHEVIRILPGKVKRPGAAAFAVTVAQMQRIDTYDAEIMGRQIRPQHYTDAPDNVPPVVLQFHVISKDQMRVASLHQTAYPAHVANHVQALSQRVDQTVAFVPAGTSHEINQIPLEYEVHLPAKPPVDELPSFQHRTIRNADHVHFAHVWHCVSQPSVSVLDSIPVVVPAS